MKKKFGWIAGTLMLGLLVVGAFGATVAYADDGGPKGPMGQHGDGVGGKRSLDGTALDTVAALLDMTPEEVTAALEAGQNLPELADAAGVDMQDIKDALSKLRGESGRGRFDGDALDTIADLLGMTPEEVTAALEAGQTLPELADKAGVNIEEIKDTMSAQREEAMRERINSAVEDGSMSQEQADWMLEGLDKGFLGKQGGFGGHGGHGFDRSPSQPPAAE